MSNRPESRSAARRDVHDDDAGFIALLDTLRAGKRTIAAAACGALLAGAAYVAIAQPVYQADILVQVVESGDAAATRSLLGDIYTLFDVKSTAAAETQILTSRLVVSRAVDALNLCIDAQPERFPIVGQWIARHADGLSEPGLFGYGGYAWGTESIDVSTFDVPHAYLDRRFTLTNLDGGRYRLAATYLDAPVDGQIGQLQRIPSPDGDIVLRVASIRARPGTRFELARHSRTDTIEKWRARLSAREKVKQSDVIVATLRSADPTLASQVLNEIGRQYVVQNVEQRSREAARSLSFLELQEPLLKARLTESEARLTALRNEQGSIDLAEEARLALSRSTDAKVHLIELRQRREALSARNAASHPDVLAIDRQIALFERERSLADGRLRRLPDLQQQVLRRMLDVRVNTELYAALSNNIQQLQLVNAGKTGNVRLVDTAAVPEEPIGPRKVLVGLASLLFGLVAGSGFTIARAMLCRGVTCPREIERRIGARVLISVPFDRAQPAPGCAAPAHAPAPRTIERDDDPAIDSMRALRVMLDHAGHRPSNGIVVTAAGECAGTVFVTTRLALAYAMSGARVLLIDGDLRNGRLSHAYGHPRTAGLSDFVAGGLAPDDLVIRDVATRIDLVTAGTTRGYAADQLTSAPLWDRLAAFAKRYDAVLVTVCPVLAAPDAAALARAAGSTLLVARAARTTLAQLDEALDRLTSSGARVSGIVLNGVDPRAAHGRFGPGKRSGPAGWSHRKQEP
ncbi:hypothetical protein WT81_01415 [Burkholderia stagnalis]|uniref:GNVR domain-containing protein n=1 Tax=Burkholderia stagnalis TaxID=1503054 RepID=UPI00075F7F84|nr:hypothetical protein WT80_24225 [Burkholderia stagnalis]KWK52941.1 hypothetical protein WT81_01415 [Burkholderia stagnalis]KWN77652.1 hypothetical protein WT90_06295 [Burkholderia stagnalis]